MKPREKAMKTGFLVKCETVSYLSETMPKERVFNHGWTRIYTDFLQEEAEGTEGNEFQIGDFRFQISDTGFYTNS